MNIHELAFKCKEWAYEQGYKIITYKHFNEWRLGIFYDSELYMNDTEVVAGDAEYWETSFNTEAEAVFKATEWVYKNTRSK